MSEQRSKPKPILYLVILAIPLFLLISAFMPKSSSTTDPTTSPEPQQALGGYCPAVMRYLNDAVQVMGGAGETTTADDIVPVLKDSGEKLSQGFDTNMVDTASNVALLNNAGKDLLRIRVDILNGDDVEADASRFMDRYNKINSMCNN
jgi:hypothetical protein